MSNNPLTSTPKNTDNIHKKAAVSQLNRTNSELFPEQNGQKGKALPLAVKFVPRHASWGLIELFPNVLN